MSPNRMSLDFICSLLTLDRSSSSTIPSHHDGYLHVISPALGSGSPGSPWMHPLSVPQIGSRNGRRDSPSTTQADASTSLALNYGVSTDHDAVTLLLGISSSPRAAAPLPMPQNNSRKRPSDSPFTSRADASMSLHLHSGSSDMSSTNAFSIYEHDQKRRRTSPDIAAPPALKSGVLPATQRASRIRLQFASQKQPQTAPRKRLRTSSSNFTGLSTSSTLNSGGHSTSGSLCDPRRACRQSPRTASSTNRGHTVTSQALNSGDPPSAAVSKPVRRNSSRKKGFSGTSSPLRHTKRKRSTLSRSTTKPRMVEPCVRLTIRPTIAELPAWLPLDEEYDNRDNGKPATPGNVNKNMVQRIEMLLHDNDVFLFSRNYVWCNRGCGKIIKTDDRSKYDRFAWDRHCERCQGGSHPLMIVPQDRKRQPNFKMVEWQRQIAKIHPRTRVSNRLLCEKFRCATFT